MQDNPSDRQPKAPAQADRTRRRVRISPGRGSRVAAAGALVAATLLPVEAARQTAYNDRPPATRLLDQNRGEAVSEAPPELAPDFAGDGDGSAERAARRGVDGDQDAIDAHPVSAVNPNGIPEIALRAYRQAEATMAERNPRCGLSWSLLAAIGHVESNHGRFGGSQLRADGSSTRPIRGIPLDGRPGIALIWDTDGGALDDDPVYDRAVGPMQFIPSTWRSVAPPGADPDNMFDAALAAAVYLCAGNGDLRDPAQLRQAVFRYNRSTEYVNTVLALAKAYEEGRVQPLPHAEPSRGPIRDVDEPDGPASVTDPGARGRSSSSSGGSGGSGGSSGSGSGGSGGSGSSGSGGSDGSPGSGSGGSSPEPEPGPGDPQPQPDPENPQNPQDPDPQPEPEPDPEPEPEPEPDPPDPEMVTILSGELPSGPWSLAFGQAGDTLHQTMHLPSGTVAATSGTHDELRSAWWVGSSDQRHLVWGYTADEVGLVVVTLTDGEVRSALTEPTGSDAGGRVFVVELPEDASIEAIEARHDDGSRLAAASHVAEDLTDVADYDPSAVARVRVALD